MMINPQDIVIDMPCSRPRVDELKASIQQVGMIQPITLWLSGQRVIDGFHRSIAAQELGLSEVPAVIVDCDEEAFWDARIQSAKQHAEIADERLAEWLFQSWRVSDFGQSKDDEELFRYVYDNRLDGYIHLGRTCEGPYMQTGFGEKRIDNDFTVWFKNKCQNWGRPWPDVAKLFMLKAGVIGGVYGRFDPREKDANFSFDEARTAAAAFYMMREADFDKDDIHSFLESGKPPQAEEARKHVNRRKAERRDKELAECRDRNLLERAQREQFYATEQGKRQKRKESMDRIAGEIEHLLVRMSFFLDWNESFTLEEAIAENPRVKAQVDLLAAGCTEFWNMAGKHLQGDALAIENKVLSAENQRLQWRAEAYEREKAKQVAKKANKARVLSSTDIEHLPHGD
jgi:hypothetical protein